MLQWDTSALGSTAAEYVIAKKAIVNCVSTDNIWAGKTVAGYNIVNFSPPLSYKKGAILDIYVPASERVAINTASTATYQDFVWAENRLLEPGMNVVAKVITQSNTGGVSTVVNSFTHSYSSPGTYSLGNKFGCDGFGYDDVKEITGKISKLNNHLTCLIYFHFSF